MYNKFKRKQTLNYIKKNRTTQIGYIKRMAMVYDILDLVKSLTKCDSLDELNFNSCGMVIIFTEDIFGLIHSRDTIGTDKVIAGHIKDIYAWLDMYYEGTSYIFIEEIKNIISTYGNISIEL